MFRSASGQPQATFQCWHCVSHRIELAQGTVGVWPFQQEAKSEEAHVLVHAISTNKSRLIVPLRARCRCLEANGDLDISWRITAFTKDQPSWGSLLLGNCYSSCSRTETISRACQCLAMFPLRTPWKGTNGFQDQTRTWRFAHLIILLDTYERTTRPFNGGHRWQCISRLELPLGSPGSYFRLRFRPTPPAARLWSGHVEKISTASISRIGFSTLTFSTHFPKLILDVSTGIAFSIIDD